MNLDAFTPQGNTVAITSAAGATTAVQVQGGQSNPNCQTYLFQNVGAVTVFVAMGSTSAVTASAPVNGTPANGVPIQPGGAPVMLKGPPNAWVSTFSTATTSTVYITPGEGGAH